MDETESPQQLSASTDQEKVSTVADDPPAEEEPKQEIKDEEDPSKAFSHSNLEASSAPPLQLLNDSELSGDLTEEPSGKANDVPQSSRDDLSIKSDEDGGGEPPVEINIEDQLKEFDGSDDEATSNKGLHEPIENLVDALCDSESSKLGAETMDVTAIQPDAEEEASQNESTNKDAFEEVDMSEVEKEKNSATEENDVLSDDRTQVATAAEAKGDDQTDYEDNESRTESRTESRMEVDGEEHDDHNDEQTHEENDEQQDDYAQEEDEDVTRDEDHGEDEGDNSHHPEDDSTRHDAGDVHTPADSTCERITPNNDDEEEEHNENVENKEGDTTTPAVENNAETDNVHDEQSNDKINESADVVTNDVEMSEPTNKEGADESVAEKMDVNEEISGNGKEADDVVVVVEISDESERLASNPRSKSERGRRARSISESDTSNTNLDESKSRTKTRMSRRLSPEIVMENNKDKNDLVKPRTRAKTMDSSHERPNLRHNAGRSKAPSVDESEEVENTEHAEHVELKELQIKELADDFPSEKCNRCRKTLTCQYKYMQDGEIGFLCSLKCTSSFRALHKETFHLIARKIPISLVFDVVQNCHLCKSRKSCRYRLKQPDDEAQLIYLCGPKCYDSFVGMNIEKFYKRRKTYLVQEVSSDVADVEKKCIRCGVSKKCLYSFRDDDNDAHFICDDTCFEVLEKEEENRLKLKRRSVRVRDLGIPPEIPTHAVSPAVANPSSVASSAPAEPRNITRTEEEAEQARFEREASLVRRCGSCYMIMKSTRVILEWETMPFCNDQCLEKYQNLIGSNCTNCNSLVSSSSMGKYCVRFGFEVRQFCSSHCLDTYKKKNIKECAHCQKDISHDKDGFLAPVGDKSQFKDFCSTACVKRYEDILNPRKKQNTGNCAVCNLDKLVRVDLTLDSRGFEFCSNPCFSAFKFVNNISPDQCTLCMKYFERNNTNAFTLYEDNTPKMFCSRICLTVFISVNRKIVSCQWCKVKKYNFDMILRNNNGLTASLCSTTCLRKYMGPGSINATSGALVVRLQKLCDQCHVNCNPTFSLAMSDSTSRNFCTQQCVIDFQAVHKRPVNDSAKTSTQKSKQAPYPVGLPKKLHPKADKSIMRPVQLGQSSPAFTSGSSSLPLSISTGIQSSSVDSEHTLPPQAQSPEFGLPATKRRGRHKKTTFDLSFDHHEPLPAMTPSPPVARPVKKRSIGVNTTETGAVKAQIITVPPPQPQMVNKQTMCQPSAEALALQANRPTCTVELQTDDSLERKYFVPVPVPMYVPQPMAMYSMPFPVPVPIPIPIPVPIFIPTTRNTAAGIMKEIKKIQDKMPADPFEAELLMMAEMVADEKRNESDSEPEDAVEDSSVVEYAPEGDDIFQMDLNISTGYDEQPNVDIENSMPANAIQQVTPIENVSDYISQQQMMMMDPQSRRLLSGNVGNARKRAASPPTPTARGRISTTPPNKRHRGQSQQQQQIISPSVDDPIRTTAEPTERPDANMCLKYTFGVNAWRQWVMNKNADLEKSTIRRKAFKTELLQLTADELNYSLCLFVKEVRKPNGSEYAPDTIYYLVLGIQQYLYENGRIDNIFTDPYYERFTDCLDDVARKFSVLYNDSQYIVTRVEEEHLWECKQLGAHSPHVLLSTLMFFNTKHFNLTTVDEHMQLSFSHIMKHWKRNNQSGKQNQSTRNVLLRFYPPQTTPDNPRKKKVYEQQENENNPLRCPVKLYEFYLSKCPESVKTRSDVFYLQPERSCVPDSPVWYSTQALSRESLNKMLHRVKMVKEINVALLSSQ